MQNCELHLWQHIVTLVTQYKKALVHCCVSHFCSCMQHSICAQHLHERLVSVGGELSWTSCGEGVRGHPKRGRASVQGRRSEGKPFLLEHSCEF